MGCYEANSHLIIEAFLGIARKFSFIVRVKEYLLAGKKFKQNIGLSKRRPQPPSSPVPPIRSDILFLPSCDPFFPCALSLLNQREHRHTFSNYYSGNTGFRLDTTKQEMNKEIFNLIFKSTKKKKRQYKY